MPKVIVWQAGAGATGWPLGYIRITRPMLPLLEGETEAQYLARSAADAAAKDASLTGFAHVASIEETQLPARTYRKHWRYNAGAIAPDPALVATERKPRLPRAILADLNALSAAQKTSIRNDLNSGTPPKWQLAASPAVWACAPVFRNATGSLQTEAAMVAVAFYCIEVPNYLVQPAFDPTINIPGDQQA